MNLKEENEKLRELLRRVYNYVPIPYQIRIDSALSEQDSNEVASPAQDEQTRFEAWAKTQGDKWLIVGGLQWSAGTDDYASARTNAAWAAWQERAALSARPAQKVNNVDTPEQQPVEIGEVRIRLENGHKQFEFEEYEAAYALPDGTHNLYAAPIAQTAPQPVAWQHKKPTVNDSGEIVGYSAWTNGKGLDWWPHRPLYAAPHKG